MTEAKDTVLTRWDAYRLRRSIHRTGGYRVRALRRLHSSEYYEVIVDDLHIGETFAVQSEADWYGDVRRPVLQVDDLPPPFGEGR